MRVTQTFTLYEAKYKRLGVFLDKILKKKRKIKKNSHRSTII